MEQIRCRIAKLFKAVSTHFLLQNFCDIYVACYESFAKVSACYLTKYLQEEGNNEQKLLLSITVLSPKTTDVLRGETPVHVVQQQHTKDGWEKPIFGYSKESRANQ